MPRFYIKRKPENDVTDLMVGSGLLLDNENKFMKQWYQSKVVWFNIVMTAIGIATSLQGVAIFDKYAVLLGLVTTIGNVVLRVWFTVQPIA